MTRINTNVSSLVAQNILGRSNASLEQALTRLSTGLRINTGKDDPAGLIASENLRSDITSIKKAIGNTDRANQVIATADSALGQVSSLLNDIRGLVTESANSGALSDQQLAANQLQVDSSLEALNRIAQTTTFQGRRLLDGSLDFITSAGANFTSVSNLQIDQANLGATGSVAVSISVSSASTRGQVEVDNIPAGGTAATASSGSVVINTQTTAATASAGSIDITIETQAEAQATADLSADGFAAAVTGSLDILSSSAFAGVDGNDLTIVFAEDSGSTTHSAALAGDVLTITVGTDDGLGGTVATVALNDVFLGLSADTDFTDQFNYTTGDVTGNYTVGADNVGGSGPVTIGFTGGLDQTTSVETITIAGIAGVASNVDITLVEANGIGATPTVTGDATNGYTINVDDAATTTIAAIAAAIEGIAEVATATYGGSASYDATNAADVLPVGAESLIGGAAAVLAAQTINITGIDGATSNIDITLIEATGIGTTPTVTGDATNGYTINIDDAATTTVAAIATAIQSIAEVATATYAGSASYVATSAATLPSGAESLLGGAATTTGGLVGPVIFELTGANGSEVLSFGLGTSITQLVAGINLVKDATGVEATANGTTLELTSSGYGSSSVVDIKVISEGTGSTPAGVFTTEVGLGSRDAGDDIVASINGVVATGNGNALSINTATLDLGTTVVAGFTGTIDFTIVGGGALFQLGADVVSNQQARLGIGSVNTARLGGVNGKLFQLGTGGSATLSSDPTTAASIIEEAIDQVTSLRGRLGAFQRTSLETNKAALSDTLVNLTDAESTIRDADFAEETANLTRAQILVQSGTTILSIANQNPQNVLALLR